MTDGRDAGAAPLVYVTGSVQDRGAVERALRRIRGYRVPRSLRGKPGRRGPIAARLRPAVSGLVEGAGDDSFFATQRQPLVESASLVVICSPHAVRSVRVDREIREYKRLHGEDSVLCCIVDGEPNASDKAGIEDQECFPEALRYRVDADGGLSADRTEPIAADLRPGKDGWSNGMLKVMAGVLGVRYDNLRQRERLRRRRYLRTVAAGLALLTAAGVWGFQSIRQAQHEELRQRFHAELEALFADLDDRRYPQAEARLESALRTAHVLRRADDPLLDVAARRLGNEYQPTERLLDSGRDLTGLRPADDGALALASAGGAGVAARTEGRWTGRFLADDDDWQRVQHLADAIAGAELPRAARVEWRHVTGEPQRHRIREITGLEQAPRAYDLPERLHPVSPAEPESGLVLLRQVEPDVRLVLWRYREGRALAELQAPPTADVRRATVAADGRVAMELADGPLLLWLADDGTVRRLADSAEPGPLAAFAGPFFVYGHAWDQRGDRRSRVWRTDARGSAQPALELGHGLRGATWLADRGELWLMAHDRWDPATVLDGAAGPGDRGREIQRTGSGAAITAVTSAGAGRVATGRTDGTVEIRGARDHFVLASLEQLHSGAVIGLWSDGTTLLSAGDDGRVHHWPLRSLPEPLTGHPGPVARLSSVGTRLLVLGGDGGARIEDAGAAAMLSPIDLPILSAYSFDDGRATAVTGRGSCTFASDEQGIYQSCPAGSLAWWSGRGVEWTGRMDAMDGSGRAGLLHTSFHHRAVAFLDLDQRIRLARADGTDPATATGWVDLEGLAASPDGARVAVVGADPDGASGEYHLGVWDAATGERVAAIPLAPGSGPRSLAFSPDGRAVLIAGGGPVRRWHPGAGPLEDLDVAGEPVTASAEYPLRAHGDLLVAVAPAGENLEIFDLRRDVRLRRLPLSSGTLERHLDVRTLDDDAETYLIEWDRGFALVRLATGTVDGPHSCGDGPQTLAVDAAGTQLAAAGPERVCVWDTATMRRVLDLSRTSAYRNRITALAFEGGPGSILLVGDEAGRILRHRLIPPGAGLAARRGER